MEFSYKIHSKLEFYDTYLKWCEGHEFPIPSEKLPEKVLVTYVSDLAIYCLWLYETNSSILWVGWPASNKEVPFDAREGGLGYTLDSATCVAKELGFSVLFTTSGTGSVIDSLEDKRFIKGDSNVSHYFKNIE